MSTTVGTTSTTMMRIHQLARGTPTPSGMGQASTTMITDAISPPSAGIYRAVMGKLGLSGPASPAVCVEQQE